jgi:predicted transcriptional regulator
MIRTPCEYIVWNGLPIIRRDLAKALTHKYGLTQKDTAEKLGISCAAVSQYLSGKRGKKEITDIEILNEIEISAEKILTSENDITIPEICRLCKILISKKAFSFKTKEYKCKSL